MPWLEEQGHRAGPRARPAGGERAGPRGAAADGLEWPLRRAGGRADAAPWRWSPDRGARGGPPWDNREVTVGQGAAAPAAGAGRRCDRRGDGAGVPAARLRARSRSSRARTRLLAREEPFAGEEVRAAFEAEGITVVTGSPWLGGRARADGPVTATLEPTARTIEATRSWCAVGRRPATGRPRGSTTVGLRAGRVRRGGRPAARGRRRRRLALRRRRLQRARAAHAHGQVPGPDRRRRDRRARTSATWPITRRAAGDVHRPAGGAVGLTEAQARERGIDVRRSATAPATWPAPTRAATASRAPASSWSTTTRGRSSARRSPARRRRRCCTRRRSRSSARCRSTRLWHAVPSFPTVSEVWLRLLEAYGL